MKYVIIFMLFLTTACSHRASNVSIQVYDTKNITPLNKCNVVADYEVLKLETTTESIIGSVDEVVIDGGYCYIADYRRSKGIFIFDENGKYINKIMRYGKANEEYIELSSIFYDKADHTINLVSRMPSKILKFNNRGDSLIMVINLERNYTSVVKIQDAYIAYQGNVTQGDDANNINYLSSNGEIKDGFMKIEKGWESTQLGSVQLIKNYNEDVYFLKSIKNDIYKYTKAIGFEPCLQLDFGDYNVSDHIKSYKEYKESANVDFCKVNEYYETKDYWLFCVVLNGQQYIAAHNKANNKSTLHTLDMENEKYFLPFGTVVSFTNSKLVTFVESFGLNYYLTGKNEYNDFSELYERQINNLNDRLGMVRELDNPILIIYSLL